MTPQTEVPNASTQAPLASISAAPTTGFRSSEFVATVATVIAVGSGHIPANYQPLVAALVGLYVAARTVLKAVHALGYAKSIPDLPTLPEVKQ